MCCRSGILRLAVSPYVHVSALHVLFNTLAFLNTGPQLERAHGSFRFAVLVLLIQILAAGLQFGLYSPKLFLLPEIISTNALVTQLLSVDRNWACPGCLVFFFVKNN